MKSFALGSIFLLVLAGVVAAQGTEAPTLRGGILNGRAISLPKPEYPDSAKSAGIGGMVGVEVLIDENGLVISAVADPMDQHHVVGSDGQPVSAGPIDPALAQAAEQAALLARFAPTLLSGRPVKVKGLIVYNFVADKSDKPPRVGDIYGPMLNGRARSLPQPEYPEAARAANIAGRVTVRVVIDPEGNVTAAEATSGPELLRPAAEDAARKAKFKPSLLGTTPTRDAGVLLYTFSMTTRKIAQ
jgi:TonB family protein